MSTTKGFNPITKTIDYAAYGSHRSKDETSEILKNLSKRVNKEFLSSSTSSSTRINDWIAMQFWKDASIFLVMFSSKMLICTKRRQRMSYIDDEYATEESS
ncbi:hypothetical protein Tco_1494127 [Tanacetum coccineum]